jgi:hypothetical protein
MRRADLLIGIGLLAFAAFYFRQSYEITVGFASDRLGPAFFPRLLALTLAGCALTLIARSLRGRSDPAPLPSIRTNLLLWTLGLTIAYVAALRPLGYLIATPLYLAALVWLLGYRSPVGLAGTAIGVTAALYLVFVQALKVLVPMGLLRR